MAVVITALLLGGCDGDDDPFPVGPGLVGISDSSDATAPLLTVTYTVPPSTSTITVQILSDAASDGDISFDPVLSSFFVANSPSTVLFGIDSFNMNLPEYRAFLTFPLDGFTGQPSIPSDALIVSADVSVFIDLMEFASVVPTFVDLVQYPFGNLGGINPADDFNQIPLDILPVFDFLFSDVGNFVRFEVTSLMETAQLPPALPDFQIRFSRDMSVPPLGKSTPSSAVGRTVSPTRTMDGIVPRRLTTKVMPLSQEELASRRR
jgi:hypothetical protein